MPIKVFLTDDSDETIEALTLVYDTHPGFEVVGHATNAADTLSALRLAHDTDIISLDIQIGADNGMELCSQIRAEFPDLYIVMCSLELGPDIRLASEHVGASFFLEKPFGLLELNTMLAAYRTSVIGSNRSADTDIDDSVVGVVDIE